MEGVCADCRHEGKLHARGRCQPCYWRAKHDADKEVCPGCSRREKLRTIASGPRCWRCVRREAPRKKPTPRRCRRCGHLRRHAAHGLCNACYQRDPLIVGVWVQGAQARLDERCPAWFGAFADWLLERSAPKVSLRHLRRLEQSLQAGLERPSALIAAVSDGGRSGRSPGDAARLLEAFLVASGLVLASDERGRLAHGRRQRRIERCPPPLRPTAERYTAWLLAGRERARRIGERPLKDHTIEQRLAVLAQLTVHLEQQNIDDWATCSRAHVESFLATGRDRGFRLAALRDFFRFARNERICLTDPSAGFAHRPARGFRGRTLPRGEQARLLRRWASGDCHPHEALVGLLALLHGASVSELRPLTDQQHQHRNENAATRSPTTPRAARPAQLRRTGTLPRPPNRARHREPARARHPRHPRAPHPRLPATISHTHSTPPGSAQACSARPASPSLPTASTRGSEGVSLTCRRIMVSVTVTPCEWQSVTVSLHCRGRGHRSGS